MGSYWVTFRSPHVKPVCVDAGSVEQAREIAQEHAKSFVDQARILPYPATPRINTKVGSMPCFCLSPERCAGHLSCPRDYSCVE